MDMRPRVLITTFRLYGTAIDLDVAPNLAVATVPAPPDLAQMHAQMRYTHICEMHGHV
jgi:hypothetical protein